MSKVQICNRALSTYLGVGRINSLDEATPAAEQCNLHFDDTLQGLLEMHPWRFAKGRQVLAELTNDRETEWGYHYARPADALVVQWVNTAQDARILINRGETPDTDRELFGQSIYSDVGSAVCEYTKMITDTTLYPRLFADALSANLAANMAMPLVEDVRRAQNAIQQAQLRLEYAMEADENEAFNRSYQTLPTYLTARGVS